MGRKYNGRKGIHVKLTSFDADKKERLHYKCEAAPKEKRKGLRMIEYLSNFFMINNKEIIEHKKKLVEEIRKNNKVKWTRDKKGRIISPFSKKATK